MMVTNTNSYDDRSTTKSTMTYSIATWNRPHHTIEQSRHDLGAIVGAERCPDILALQECKRSDDTLQTAWSGFMDSKGFGISVRPDWSVQHGAITHDSRSVRPFVVRTHNGPLHVLVVWAHLEPTYVEGVMKGLKANDEFLRAAPSIVLGDFNSHPRFDRNASRHDSITHYLEEEHGLVSAYHAYNPCTPGNELHWNV